MISAANKSDIAVLWPVVAPWIAGALPYAKGRWTLASLCRDLSVGLKRLWLVFKEKAPIACFVTCNTTFPGARVCTILIAGGIDSDSWVGPGLVEVEEAARKEGCGQVEIIGRAGWERKCPSYTKAGVWLVKELS